MAQLHHTRGRQYDDPLRADVHEEDERGGETKSTMQKVKAKVDKLKDTIKPGHGDGGEDHKDEAETVNRSPAVRSGLMEPTVMGTPVLAEDLHATHSNIIDPPVRSFAQWEEEEKHGDPPPLSTDYGTHLPDLSQVGHHAYRDQDENRGHLIRGSIGKSTVREEDLSAPNRTTRVSPVYHQRQATNPTNTVNPPVRPFTQREEERRDAPPPPSTGGYGARLPDMSTQVGHHAYGEDVNREQLMGSIGKSTGMEEDPSAPKLTTTVSPGNYQSKVTVPTNTGGKEAGMTDVPRSFDKMSVYDEPDTKSLKSDQNKPKGYTGCHDQFAPEPLENPPLDTIAQDPSNPNSSYTQKISSATSAIADKAAAVKDSITSKISSSGEDKRQTITESQKTNTKLSSPTDYAHKVADKLAGTLGPVYETVVGAGGAVMSKMQGSGHDDTTGNPETERVPGVTVKKYLVNTFKSGDDDKVLSEVISHAFHRGKPNEPPQETTTTTTTDVIRDEGERRLQDSGN